MNTLVRVQLWLQRPGVLALLVLAIILMMVSFAVFVDPAEAKRMRSR